MKQESKKREKNFLHSVIRQTAPTIKRALRNMHLLLVKVTTCKLSLSLTDPQQLELISNNIPDYPQRVHLSKPSMKEREGIVDFDF